MNHIKYYLIIRKFQILIFRYFILDRDIYLQQALHNLIYTSRTSRGIINFSSCTYKKDKIININKKYLQTKTIKNFITAWEFISLNKLINFQNTQELGNFVENIARIINQGIVHSTYLIRNENSNYDKSNHKSKYPYTNINKLIMHLHDFYQKLLNQLNSSLENPIYIAAWIEFRVNLTDHFFVDGCSKISMILQYFVLMKSHIDLPIIINNDEKYKYISKKKIKLSDPFLDHKITKFYNYYQSLFIMRNICKLNSLEEIDAYIVEINKNYKHILAGRSIIGEHNNYIYFINEFGFLEKSYKTLYGQRLEKINILRINKKNSWQILELIKYDPDEKNTSTYKLRKYILEKNPHLKSYEVFTYGKLPSCNKKLKLFLKNSTNYLKVRRDLHMQICKEIYQLAINFSKYIINHGKPQLILMRGNTGVGKTYILQNCQEKQILAVRNKFFTANNHINGIINPEEVKAKIRHYEQELKSHPTLSHYQVHNEASIITDKIIKKLIINNISFIIDKRFNDLNSLNQEIWPLIKNKNYKIIMFDIDRDIKNSCESVLYQRQVTGKDSLVPFEKIVDGYEKVRQYRNLIINLPWIDEYYLYYNSELVLVKKNLNSSKPNKNQSYLKIFDYKLREKVTTINIQEINYAKKFFQKSINNLVFKRKNYLPISKNQ